MQFVSMKGLDNRNKMADARYSQRKKPTGIISFGLSTPAARVGPE